MTERELEKYRKLLGLRIKELRESRGLTQEDMEDLRWLSVRSFQDIERGKVTPRLSSLLIICKRLHIQPKDLLAIDIQL